MAGKSWICTAKNRTSMRPSQNTGMLNRPTASALTRLSVVEPGRRAIHVPITVPTTMESARLVPTSSSVAGTRDMISAKTGSRER
jgi:hypothetical protein